MSVGMTEGWTAVVFLGRVAVPGNPPGFQVGSVRVQTRPAKEDP